MASARRINPELCNMIDVCCEGSAEKITAVIPYFGYARADQKISENGLQITNLCRSEITESPWAGLPTAKLRCFE
ncbi:hypothetical protein KSP39_PZI018745 [Platanthera zijinensis]|uniref:Ribose-phosphate pyrophosphokinase N-terminal domain-containing protein n=1 Tax=Platanthera zijinensis TaxID=2320716 RepID=A0AAP0B377_9ASPA